MQTNDPNRPWLEVVLTGTVEPFVEIRPERVKLTGPPGALPSTEVEIIPRPEYPFVIKDITARSGEFITFALTQRCSDGHDRCIVRVGNSRTTAGRYADVLSVTTDSLLKPVIPIFVVGMIQ